MMRNIVCVTILLGVSAAGVFAACNNDLKRITQRGNFHNTTGAALSGHEYDWPTCKQINSQPTYEAGVQDCYGGLHDLPYWNMVSFSKTCTVNGVQEVSGGMRYGEEAGVVNYCDCYVPE